VSLLSALARSEELHDSVEEIERLQWLHWTDLVRRWASSRPRAVRVTRGFRAPTPHGHKPHYELVAPEPAGATAP